MKLFYNLILNTKKALSVEEKGMILLQYLKMANSKDKLFALELVIGKRQKRFVTNGEIKEWLFEVANLPDWLLEKCLEVSGDLAETITLLANLENEERENLSLVEMGKLIETIDTKDKIVLNFHFQKIWKNNSKETIFVFCKLLLGGLNFSIPNIVLLKVLSDYTRLSIAHLTQKIEQSFDGLSVDFDSFIYDFNSKKNRQEPYPFSHYSLLEKININWEECKKYRIEKAWQKERVQVIIRDHSIILWTESNELITNLFLEFKGLKNELPSETVLEGYIVVLKAEKVCQIDIIKERIGKSKINPIPNELSIIFMATDVLEFEGTDIRFQSMDERMAILQKIVDSLDSHLININPSYEIGTEKEWLNFFEKSKNDFLEGFFIRKQILDGSGYENQMSLWQIPPKEIILVLLYATKGNLKNANEYIDFTFGIMGEVELVPITKALNNLDEQTQKELEQFIANNTKEKFGPIRSVVPTQLFKVSYTAVLPSKRHKSGVILKFPKIVKWLKNEAVEKLSLLSDLNQFVL
ncbi:MAG: hypothetical protein IPN93_04650 [Bacteroidetes bacterium]|nr:hypothetical protein [Bacteroidota bacterium]MBK9634051.1 hypothetical protein [Bacteroidota bacterium]